MESTLSISLLWAHIHWNTLQREHRLVDSDFDPKLIAKISRSKIVGLILYLIAIAVSFLNTNVSLILLFALIPVYYFIPQQYFWFRFTKDR